jgi:hypothetical protein
MKHPVTKIRKRRKKEVVESFGGECQICGYNKNVNALCFHHTDPTIKENNPTTIINQWRVDRSIQQLIKERVVLLCLNCHAEVHSEDYSHDNFTVDNPNKKSQILCSPECSEINRRKVKERPNSDELKLLIEKYPFTRIGKMFGVSDNAVRKWAKKYDIL